MQKHRKLQNGNRSSATHGKQLAWRYVVVTGKLNVMKLLIQKYDLSDYVVNSFLFETKE